MSDSVLQLTDDNFQAHVLDSFVPVLVDFWAEWCGPCHQVAPIVEQLAEKYKGDLLVGKVDIDQNPELAGKYGVLSIPTLILFQGGQPAKQVVGAQPLVALEKALNLS